MDGLSSSGEELILKARKPYTITKQRERWTEEEHNRFLEALKLYGRAWQRIEEHIGTKTAVQIRSHAQKFFTKLEKEALIKGVPAGQALDIEIPPPRPKRKPSIPYPRKLNDRHATSHVGLRNGRSGFSTPSVPLAEGALDLEREPPSEVLGDINYNSAKDNQDKDTSTRTCAQQLHHDVRSSSANKHYFAVTGKTCAFRELVPDLEEVVTSDEKNESYIIEPKAELYSDKVDAEQPFEKDGCGKTKLAKPPTTKDNLSEGTLSEQDQTKNFETQPRENEQATQSHPRHVPVNILDGGVRVNTVPVRPHMTYHESVLRPPGGLHAKSFTDYSSSVTSENQACSSHDTINQPFPGFYPILAPIQNHEDYQSLIHASSTFTKLIVSALLQNPAAHAAASLAASMWPFANMEVPACNAGGFPVGLINAAPSMAAIAATTVASATAWWASQGLLPLCPPFHVGISCVPVPAYPVQMGVSQARGHDDEKKEETSDPASEAQQMDTEFSEALQDPHLALNSPALSSSDSEESGILKSSNEIAVVESAQGGVEAQLHDSNKPKVRKQVDRSSCGSNTPSSSEVDADNLEKQEKSSEELGKPAVNHPTGDTISRRTRSSSCCSTDSWKEVSEEGRVAFQALFSREVLPQSFSPPYDSKNKGNVAEKERQSSGGKVDEGTKFDLNGKIWFNCSSNPEEEKASWRGGSSNNEDGLRILGKFKLRCTGFKPYKRCSVEAKEGKGSCANISQDEEKRPKRVRLEGEASA